MTTHTVEAIHIYCADAPYTYLVFGPYPSGTFDVEVHEDHVTYETSDRESYITTVSDLPRNTHIVGDMWDTMDAIVRGEITREDWNL